METPRAVAALDFVGPTRTPDFELWEARDLSSPDPREHVYSCIALCTRQWTDRWPALGGTRWVKSESDDPERWREEARHQAIELAMAMYIKNSVLRKAAVAAKNASGEIFGWQGGKGVIWTPYGAELTEHRLRCHGKLIQHLGGRYVGSKDKGVGTSQLEILAEETPFTIGLGCGKDTGEATAYGVLAGLEAAMVQPELGLGGFPGRAVLVVGAGKVGLPLIQLLAERGARVFVFDPDLDGSPASVGPWIARQQLIGAAIDQRHAETLTQLAAAGAVLPGNREADALRHPEVEVVSPNGGPTEWLSRPPAGADASRAALLAETAARHGRLRLIAGAGNDQVSATPAGRVERGRTLDILAAAGVCFVPDPLVSPGGVIAVSHERSPVWNADLVNADALLIVKESVGRVFAAARRLGGTDAVTLYRAFEELVEAPSWDEREADHE